jgi:hypothetical protein
MLEYHEARKPGKAKKRKQNMGEISKRLHRKLASKGLDLPTAAPKRRSGEPLPGNVKDVQTLISDGYDPVHAAYLYIQQISSMFAEGASQLPELKEYAKFAGKAEEEYMPSGPPMSPLTVSYFTCWVFYDLRFGRDGETIGQCQIDANDLIGLNPDQLDALKKMSAARMGIYEHVGTDGPLVLLRELVTDDGFPCHIASGYKGRKGEIWYIRLLPPLLPDVANYHIGFTTPYILQASQTDWLNFLRRAMLPFKATSDREALHRLLKFGPEPNYWNEFVLKAYHHHQPDAIFLTGIPDLKDTLPHA